MDQRGFAAILSVILILLITLFIGSVIYYFVNQKNLYKEEENSTIQSYSSNKKTTQSQLPESIKPIVHLADDASVSLEKIKIMAVLFIPKDVELPLDDKWRNLAQEWNKDVVSFWENVLDNKSDITFETLPETIKGTKNANDYDYNSVYQETIPKLSTLPKLSPYFQKQRNEYLTLFIYVLSDDNHFYKDSGRATHLNIQEATVGLFIGTMNHKFELFDKTRGGVPAEEAHELGHALGLQHSTDDPKLIEKYLKGNVWTSACDLMLGSKIVDNQSISYIQDKDWDNAKTLQELDCIIPEQKELFFK